MKIINSVILFIFVFCITNGYAQNIFDVELHSNFNTLQLNIIPKKYNRGIYFPRVELYDLSRTLLPSNFNATKTTLPINSGSVYSLFYTPDSNSKRINSSIYAKVFLKKELAIPVSKHILKSLIFPGWGDYKLRNGKFYFVYGLVHYGLLYYSLQTRQKAIDSYNIYKTSLNPSESESNYKKAIQNRNTTYALWGACGLLLTVDIAMIISKARSVKKNPTIEKSKFYFNRSNEELVYTSNIIDYDNRSEYDIAIDEGNQLVLAAKQAKDYAGSVSKYGEAKTKFQRALNTRPNDKTATTLISQINSEITKLNKLNDEYNKYIKFADNELNNNNLNDAIVNYKKALFIYPNNTYPQTKIDEINSILARDKIINDLYQNAGSFSDGIEIYRDYYVTVYIQFKLNATNCVTNKQNRYRFQTIGPGYPYNKTYTYTFKIKDCNGNIVPVTNDIIIGGNGYNETLKESPDYMFIGELQSIK